MTQELTGELRRTIISQLYRDYEQIDYTYRLKLPRCQIDVRSLQSMWGYWDSCKRLIVLQEDLVLSEPWPIVLEVLKHEMAHQLVSEVLGQEDSHGPAFQKACQRLAVATWARSPVCEIATPLGFSQTTGSKDQRLLARIQKLLQLARGGTKHEAEQAMVRVQQLQQEHGIHVSDDDDFEYRFVTHEKKRMTGYQVQTAALLVEFFGVQIVHTSTFSRARLAEVKGFEILGRRQAVEIAEYVYWFIINNSELLWQTFRRGKPGNQGRSSFNAGVIAGLRRQMVSVQPPAPRSATRLPVKSPGRGALAAAADQALLDYVGAKHPRLSSRTVRSSERDLRAFRAGEEQGRNLTIRPGVKPGSRVAGFLEARCSST